MTADAGGVSAAADTGAVSDAVETIPVEARSALINMIENIFFMKRLLLLLFLFNCKRKVFLWQVNIEYLIATSVKRILSVSRPCGATRP